MSNFQYHFRDIKGIHVGGPFWIDRSKKKQVFQNSNYLNYS